MKILRVKFLFTQFFGHTKILGFILLFNLHMLSYWIYTLNIATEGHLAKVRVTVLRSFVVYRRYILTMYHFNIVGILRHATVELSKSSNTVRIGGTLFVGSLGFLFVGWYRLCLYPEQNNSWTFFPHRDFDLLTYISTSSVNFPQFVFWQKFLGTLLYIANFRSNIVKKTAHWLRIETSVISSELWW